MVKKLNVLMCSVILASSFTLFFSTRPSNKPVENGRKISEINELLEKIDLKKILDDLKINKPKYLRSKYLELMAESVKNNFAMYSSVTIKVSRAKLANLVLNNYLRKIMPLKSERKELKKKMMQYKSYLSSKLYDRRFIRLTSVRKIMEKPKDSKEEAKEFIGSIRDKLFYTEKKDIKSAEWAEARRKYKLVPKFLPEFKKMLKKKREDVMNYAKRIDKTRQALYSPEKKINEMVWSVTKYATEQIPTYDKGMTQILKNKLDYALKYAREIDKIEEKIISGGKGAISQRFIDKAKPTFYKLPQYKSHIRLNL